MRRYDLFRKLSLVHSCVTFKNRDIYQVENNVWINMDLGSELTPEDVR